MSRAPAVVSATEAQFLRWVEEAVNSIHEVRVLVSDQLEPLRAGELGRRLVRWGMWRKLHAMGQRAGEPPANILTFHSEVGPMLVVPPEEYAASPVFYQTLAQRPPMHPAGARALADVADLGTVVS